MQFLKTIGILLLIAATVWASFILGLYYSDNSPKWLNRLLHNSNVPGKTTKKTATEGEKTTPRLEPSDRTLKKYPKIE
jgi:hypothetical protein